MWRRQLPSGSGVTALSTLFITSCVHLESLAPLCRCVYSLIDSCTFCVLMQSFRHVFPHVTDRNYHNGTIHPFLMSTPPIKTFTETFASKVQQYNPSKRMILLSMTTVALYNADWLARRRQPKYRSITMTDHRSCQQCTFFLCACTTFIDFAIEIME